MVDGVQDDACSRGTRAALIDENAVEIPVHVDERGCADREESRTPADEPEGAEQRSKRAQPVRP